MKLACMYKHLSDVEKPGFVHTWDNVAGIPTGIVEDEKTGWLRVVQVDSIRMTEGRTRSAIKALTNT